MVDSFSYKGSWFLPEQPDNRVSGFLNFDGKGKADLELIGSLDNGDINELNDIELILGLTTSGHEVTLYKCYHTGRNTSSGVDSTNYLIGYIFVGSHFSKMEDLKFSSISVWYHNIDNWFKQSGFKSARNPGEFSFTFISPDPIEFEIDDKVDGQFYFEGINQNTREPNRKITLEQRVKYIIKSKDEEIHFQEMMYYLHHFQDFLTIATYEPCFPLSIVVESENHQTVLDERLTALGFPEKVRNQISVYFGLPITLIASKPKFIYSLLFTYDDIVTDFPSIIKTWHGIEPRLKPAKNLLLESFYNRSHFNENMFLNVIHAIETFHRRFRSNEVIDPKEHKKRITEILRCVGDKFKEWLSTRFIHSNEPSLKQRLQELIEEFSTTTFNKVVKDKEQFIKETKNSRNYYTHYDSKLEAKALGGGELFDLTQKLRLILVSAILHEIGFDKQLLESLLQRNEYRLVGHLSQK